MSDELEATPAPPPAAPAALELASAVEGGPPPRATSSHRGAFNLASALLVLVAVGAIVALVIILTRPDDAGERPWSAFVPTASGSSGAREIARQVAGRYVFPDGEAIVSITSEPLQLADAPVEGIVLREVDTLGREQDLIVDPGGSYAFTLCGTGEGCSIERGEPSRDRLRVLSLSALKLALYSFRYLDARSVVAFMPPAPGAEPAVALFFRREQFEPLIGRPLVDTVPTSAPSPETLSPAQAESIDALTAEQIYRYDYRTLQGIATLVLSHPDLPALQELFPTASSGSTQAGQ